MGFAIAPHLVFYLKIDERTLIRRVLESRGMNYWESGMDLKLADDIHDSFRAYQRALLREYARWPMSSGSGCSTRSARSRRSRKNEPPGGEFLAEATPGRLPDIPGPKASPVTWI